MAPEQLQVAPAEVAADLRTDICSLGVVLYRLLTGRLPFERSGLWSLRAAILAGDPAPLAQGSVQIPSVVAATCQRCLARQPSDRYQSARELAHSLRAALHDCNGESDPADDHRSDE